MNLFTFIVKFKHLLGLQYSPKADMLKNDWIIKNDVIVTGTMKSVQKVSPSISCVRTHQWILVDISNSQEEKHPLNMTLHILASRGRTAMAMLATHVWNRAGQIVNEETFNDT